MKIMKVISNSPVLILILGMLGCATGGGRGYKSSQDWVEASKSGARLPLGSAADVWSDAKDFKTSEGAAFQVKSKFTKQKGATCYFDVQFINNNDFELNKAVILVSESTAEINGNNLTRISVKPRSNATWGMERYSCPIHLGTTTDMADCADCTPILVFSH